MLGVNKLLLPINICKLADGGFMLVYRYKECVLFVEIDEDEDMILVHNDLCAKKCLGAKQVFTTAECSEYVKQFLTDDNFKI